MKAIISDSTDGVASESGAHGPRRRWILGASAATAAVLGAGTAWWRTQNTGGAGTTLQGAPIAGFWSLQWETPQGMTVATQSFRGHPLLINFWATWCPPCVEELPLINDFYRQNKSSGWNVLALAIDKPTAVQAFLQKMPLDFSIGIAGLSGAELGRELGNLAGSLPFSVALGANGEISQRKIGRLSSTDLETWLRLK